MAGKKNPTITNLENQIADLPVGYVSKKKIRGKDCFYRQWKENGKLLSKYIPSSEVDYMIQAIDKRKRLEAQLHLELCRIEGVDDDRFLEYAQRFFLGRHVPIGVQSYAELIQNKLFYIDKTDFLSKWWNSMDEITLITRPRRFGKTLTLRMVECFFSNSYANRTDLFEHFKVWLDPDFRLLQGTFPVIFLSFAAVKFDTAEGIKSQLANQLSRLLLNYHYLEEENLLTDSELILFHRYQTSTSYEELLSAIPFLCQVLHRIYHKKVILLLDEYDTPMLEAWNSGVWQDCSNYIRNLMNAMLKSNPYLCKALLTGITRIGKESFFSDLNNIKVCSLTSDDYATCFGFTEEEVFAAMREQNLKSQSEVKAWYDGFTVGQHTGIYNPWSIINYLRTHDLKAYWAHSASNQLINTLFQPGDSKLKQKLENLLNGQTIMTPLREELTFEEFSSHPESIWSLLLASGYLKITSVPDSQTYELALTNQEVHSMFMEVVRGWFSHRNSYNAFLEALLLDDVDFMMEYLSRITEEVFSFYDTSGREPEKFYHGLFLGLSLDLQDRYYIRSNRESGLGRFDVMLEPKTSTDHAILLEFKVHRSRKEKSLQDSALAALSQIEDQKYATDLIARGIPADNIYKYGIAFEGSNIWIEGSH